MLSALLLACATAFVPGQPADPAGGKFSAASPTSATAPSRKPNSVRAQRVAQREAELRDRVAQRKTELAAAAATPAPSPVPVSIPPPTLIPTRAPTPVPRPSGPAPVAAAVAAPAATIAQPPDAKTTRKQRLEQRKTEWAGQTGTAVSGSNMSLPHVRLTTASASSAAAGTTMPREQRLEQRKAELRALVEQRKAELEASNSQQRKAETATQNAEKAATTAVPAAPSPQPQPAATPTPKAKPTSTPKPTPTPLSEAAQRDKEYAAAAQQARKLAEAGDTAGARAAYERAAAIRIDKADPWLEIANLYARDKENAAAEKAALRGVEVDPQSKCYDFAIQAARRYIGNKEFAQAIAVLEPLHRLRPDDWDVTDRLYLAYNNHERAADSARDGRGAVERYVNVCTLRPVQPAPARQFLDLFAAACAETGQIDASVAWAREQYPSPAPQSAEALVTAALLRQQAAEVCLRQSPGEATEVLASVYTLVPGDTASVMPLASRVEAEKGTDLAGAFLDACTARFPDRVSLRNDQAQFYFQAGIYDKAEVIYRALDTDPKPLNVTQSRLLGCLVQQAKLDDLDRESARIAEAIETSAQPVDGKAKIGPAERKRLIDQLADFHIRAAREVQRRNTAAAQSGTPPPATEAIDYLIKCRSRFPESREVPRTIASLMQGDKRFDEATAIYREIYEADPKLTGILESLADCLVAQHRYDEAVTFVQERIRQIGGENQTPKERADRVAQLETRYADVLSGSSLMRDKITTATAALAAAPTSATLHGQLAKLLLGAGQGDLALGEFLEAATLSGQGDELVETALKVARERRSPLGLSYANAAIEHFPVHSRIFELIEETLRLRNARDPRFAYAAEGVAAMKDATAACMRVAASPGATAEQRLEARMKALLYRYEPMPSEPEIWTEVRAQLAAFLDDPQLTPRLRKAVLDNLADVDTKRLADPRSAYKILEDMAREDPKPETLQRVVSAAQRLNPRPDPAVLVDYVHKNVLPQIEGAMLTRQEIAKDKEPSQLQMLAMATAWLWDMGRRDEAMTLLKPCVDHLNDNRPATRALAKRLLAQVRRASPDVAAAIEAPKPDPALAGAVCLTRTVFHESGADDLTRPVVYEDTRLDVPRDVFPRQTVTLAAAERPAAAEPAVFFQQRPGAARPWEGVWRPADTTEWRADATDSFIVTTHATERDGGPVALRRTFREDPARAGTLRYDVVVRAPQGGEVVVNYGGRWFNTPPIEVLPASGTVDKANHTVAFKDLSPALLAAGTTLTLRFQQPDESTGARWRDVPAPSVVFTVTDEVRDEPLRKEGPGEWTVATPDGAMQFRVAVADDMAGDIPAKVTVRHRYCLQDFGR